MTLKECSNILWMWLGGSCSSYWLSWTNKLMFQYFLIFYTSHPKSAVLLLFKQVSTTLHSPAMKTDSNTSVNHFLQKEKWQYKPLTFSERITITTFFFFFRKPQDPQALVLHYQRICTFRILGGNLLFFYVIYNSRFVTYAGAYDSEFVPRSEQLHQNLKAWEWGK